LYRRKPLNNENLFSIFCFAFGEWMRYIPSLREKTEISKRWEKSKMLFSHLFYLKKLLLFSTFALECAENVNYYLQDL
jgi:hypothetical protein